jgi:hypothetical protein
VLRLAAITITLIVSLVLGPTLSKSEELGTFGVWRAWTGNLLGGGISCNVHGSPNLILHDGFQQHLLINVGFSSSARSKENDYFDGLVFMADPKFEFFAQVDDKQRFPLVNDPPNEFTSGIQLADPALNAQFANALRNGDLLVIDGVAIPKAHMQVYWRLAGLSEALDRARQACGLPLLPATGYVANPNVSLPWATGELKMLAIGIPGFLVLMAIIIWGGSAFLRAIDESLAARERAVPSRAGADPPPADPPRAPERRTAAPAGATFRIEPRAERIEHPIAQGPAPSPVEEAHGSPLPEPTAEAHETPRDPPALPVVTRSSPPPDTPRSVPAAVMPPAQGLALKLKRSQKRSFTGTPIYMLDARIDASAEVRAHIAKHRLGGRVVYESSSREKHREAALGHLAESEDGQPGFFAPAGEQAKGVAKSFWSLGRAAVSATRAALSLRITVDSLLSGEHVECNSLEELLDAEQQIKEAALNLKDLLGAVATFDGREDVIEL